MTTNLAVETCYVLCRHNGWVAVDPRCAVCGERWAEGDTATRTYPFPFRHDSCPEPQAWRDERERAAMEREMRLLQWPELHLPELCIG